MVISIVNQKGGTGKTTTALNLSSCLAKLNKSVLLLGMDLQADLSYALAIDETDKTIGNVLLNECNINDTIVTREGFDVIPGNIDLADVELTLIDLPERESVLKSKLKELNKKYDYIIIDCSPSLSLLTINALVAATHVLIPLQLTVLGVNGLDQMLYTIGKINKVLNPDLKILGVLRVMIRKQKKLYKEINQYLHDHFDVKIFDTKIYYSIKAAEAPSHGKSVVSYAPNSKSALNYMELAEEIIKIIENKTVKSSKIKKRKLIPEKKEEMSSKKMYNTYL